MLQPAHPVRGRALALPGRGVSVGPGTFPVTSAV